MNFLSFLFLSVFLWKNPSHLPSPNSEPGLRSLHTHGAAPHPCPVAACQLVTATRDWITLRFISLARLQGNTTWCLISSLYGITKSLTHNVSSLGVAKRWYSNSKRWCHSFSFSNRLLSQRGACSHLLLGSLVARIIQCAHPGQHPFPSQSDWVKNSHMTQARAMKTLPGTSSGAFGNGAHTFLWCY